MSQAVEAHLDALAKELTCTICQDVIEPPVGRLPCCHYYCRSCITKSIKYNPKCPECSAKISRRDVADDPLMDRIARAVRGLQGARDTLAAAARAAAAGGPVTDAEAIPWLQGVDDAVFAESPTHSLSASALDRLRGRDGAANATMAAGRGRSPSPMVLHRCTSEQGTSKPAAVAPASAAAGKRSARKRASGDGSGSQSIHKWLRKDAAGAKAPAAAAAETPKEQAQHAQQAQHEDGSPDVSGSLMLPGAAEDAVRQLDDIVAGLDVAESQPPSAAPAPAPAPAAAPSVQLPKKKEEPKKQPASKKKGTVAAVEAPSDKENRSGGAGGAKKRRAAEVEAPALEEAGGSRRRIPTRLMPWPCAVCTFENKGGDVKCQMCRTAKGAETPPAAVAAIAAVAPATTASPAPGTAAAAVATAAGLAVTGGKDAGSGRAPGKNEARRGAVAAQQRKLTTKKTRDRRAADNAEETPAETPGAPAGAVWTAGPQSWVLLGSGLDQAGKEALSQLAAASGASITESWAPEVTHIVCGGTSGRAARRTFKYLMGVLHGRWVVTQEWTAACLASGRPESEEGFEVRSDGAGGCGAAAARTAGASAARHLLRGFDVQLQGEFANRGQVETLLRAAGANVVARLPATGGAGRGTRSAKALSGGGVVLVEIPDASEAAAAGFRAAIAAQPWFARALENGVPVAAHRWATDSVSRFQACPLDGYLIRP